MPGTLDFSHLPPQLQALPRVDGRVPGNTPIEALGLTKEGTAQLTQAAAKLSKADLEDLTKDPASAQKRLGLSVADINSISAAFSEPIQVGHGAGKDVTACCCCCPCCTCAAAVSIVQAVR